MERITVNQQKAIVAEHLIREAGTLVEFWSEKGDPDIPVEFVRECLQKWLQRLPGTAWDTQLDHPGRPS